MKGQVEVKIVTNLKTDRNPPLSKQEEKMIFVCGSHSKHPCFTGFLRLASYSVRVGVTPVFLVHIANTLALQVSSGLWGTVIEFTYEESFVSSTEINNTSRISLFVEKILFDFLHQADMKSLNSAKSLTNLIPDVLKKSGGWYLMMGCLTFCL